MSDDVFVFFIACQMMMGVVETCDIPSIVVVF